MSGETSDSFNSSPFPFADLHEINERCLQLLVSEARSERRSSIALVMPLREVLLQLGADARRRAAQRGVLLVDLRLQDVEYWESIQRAPTRSCRTLVAWGGSFPRRSAAPLARSVLVLARHTLKSHREAALLLLGIAPRVARVIASLSLSELDVIASMQFRHLHPRWMDQPVIWRELLQSAQLERTVALSKFDIHGLQLITASRSNQRERRHTAVRRLQAEHPAAGIAAANSPRKR